MSELNKDNEVAPTNSEQQNVLAKTIKPEVKECDIIADTVAPHVPDNEALIVEDTIIVPDEVIDYLDPTLADTDIPVDVPTVVDTETDEEVDEFDDLTDDTPEGDELSNEFLDDFDENPEATPELKVNLVQKGSAKRSIDKGDVYSKSPHHEPIKISSVSNRKSVERYKDFKPDKSVKVYKDPAYQKAVIDQYITGTTKLPGTTKGRSISRSAYPYSGIYLDMSSFSGSETSSIHRATFDVDYLDKVGVELYSAYEHTVNTSLGREISYEEWLSAILWPDADSIYFGIYNTNHPGMNTYDSHCDNCGQLISTKRSNDSITYVADSSKDDITIKSIKDIMGHVDKNLIKSAKIGAQVHEMPEILTDSLFRIFYGMPNMEQVMTYLKYMRDTLKEDEGVIKYTLLPTSYMVREGVDEPTQDVVMKYKLFLHVRTIHVMHFDEAVSGEQTTQTIGAYVETDPLTIPILMNQITTNDIIQMVQEKDLVRMVNKEGVIFRVKNSICEHHGCAGNPLLEKQFDIALDPRNLIFTGAESLHKAFRQIM